MLSDAVVVARKQYKCFVCGEQIQRGEIHRNRTGKSDGDFWRVRIHTECDAATSDWNLWDWECFEPGTLKRPGVEAEV